MYSTKLGISDQLFLKVQQKWNEQQQEKPANTKGNAQQQCTFENPVKQNQSPDGARRLATNYL